MEPDFYVTLMYAMTLWFFVVGVARKKCYEPQMIGYTVSGKAEPVELSRLRTIVRRSYLTQKWSIILAVLMTLGLMAVDSAFVGHALVLDLALTILYLVMARRNK